MFSRRWVPGGKKEKWHYEPGDTVKSATAKAVIVTAIIVYCVGQRGFQSVSPDRRNSFVTRIRIQSMMRI
jgi:hypothetical protein